MNEHDLISREPQTHRRQDYVSPNTRAIAAGAASATTTAILAFVLVVMPPIESGAVSLASEGALSGGCNCLTRGA